MIKDQVIKRSAIQREYEEAAAKAAAEATAALPLFASASAVEKAVWHAKEKVKDENLEAYTAAVNPVVYNPQVQSSANAVMDEHAAKQERERQEKMKKEERKREKEKKGIRAVLVKASAITISTSAVV